MYLKITDYFQIRSLEPIPIRTLQILLYYKFVGYLFCVLKHPSVCCNGFSAASKGVCCFHVHVKLHFKMIITEGRLQQART